MSPDEVVTIIKLYGVKVSPQWECGKPVWWWVQGKFKDRRQSADGSTLEVALSSLVQKLQNLFPKDDI